MHHTQPMFVHMFVHMFCIQALTLQQCTHNFSSLSVVPYTRVNKRIRLFQKLQGNMRLIPNMRLIMRDKN